MRGLKIGAVLSEDEYFKLMDYEAEDFLKVGMGAEAVYSVLEKMSPYGVGNPKPVFLFKDVEVAGVRPFGQTKNHLELSFENSRGDIFNAISFFTKANDPLKNLKAGDAINLKASLEKSFFKQYPELRLRIGGFSA